MQCNYCGQQVSEDKAVTVNTNVNQEVYCGSPRSEEELSCWQRMIMGWYWSISSAPGSNNGEERETSPRPSFRRLVVLGPSRRP